jgi:hypothetical protein
LKAFESEEDDLSNRIDIVKSQLHEYSLKLNKLGEDIVTALAKKNRGKGGFKFIFNVKYYGDFKFSTECSADTDAQGNVYF